MKRGGAAHSVQKGFGIMWRKFLDSSSLWSPVPAAPNDKELESSSCSICHHRDVAPLLATDLLTPLNWSTSQLLLLRRRCSSPLSSPPLLKLFVGEAALSDGGCRCSFVVAGAQAFVLVTAQATVVVATLSNDGRRGSRRHIRRL
nr:hypothetical protein Iba_chr13dCG8750 [Ipomoea batatas]